MSGNKKGFRSFLSSFAKDKAAVISSFYVMLLIAVALFANFLAPYDPTQQFSGSSLLPPSFLEGGDNRFLLGTDEVGRDVLSRLIYGTRLSLALSIGALMLSMIAGISLGMIAGYFRGILDTIIMRIVDVMLAMPSILLSLVIVTVFGPSLFNATVAIAIATTPTYIRLTRSLVITQVHQDYVIASRMMGASHLRQMFVNILPNCLPALVVQCSLGLSSAVLDIAALGFLGLGAQPPSPEWGTMLSNVLQFAYSAWWLAISPGICIFLTVLAFNLIGDGLNDALDPRQKR